jgi:hypothetical protein
MMWPWQERTEASIKLDLLERGQFDREILDMVRGETKLPFDEFQEYRHEQNEQKNRLLMFAAQAALSFGVVTFSMIMIGKHGIDAAYFGTISGVLGYWLPSPMSSRPVPKKIVSPLAATSP